MNVRRASWPGINVRQESPLWYTGKIKFKEIYFELKDIETTTEFSIRLPDGKTLRSDQLTTTALAPYVTPFDKLVQETHPSWADWLIIEYDTGHVRVYFENNEATRVYVRNSRQAHPQQSVPAVGNRDGTQFYQLPITEEELIKLFGKPKSAGTSPFIT